MNLEEIADTIPVNEINDTDDIKVDAAGSRKLTYLVPSGTKDNSPAIHRWVRRATLRLSLLFFSLAGREPR